MISKPFVAAVLAGCASLAVSSQALAVDLATGQRVYNMNCAVCHGMTGVPSVQQAPSFSNKERLMQPDMVLLQSVKMGKNMCPPFIGRLKDDEILSALLYARNLR
jgi:cytochrome c6